MNKIGFVGNYLPRKCGIATFTADLVENLVDEYPGIEALVLPVNDGKDDYEYPERVRFEIEEQELSTYYAAAKYLNLQSVELVCVQHEYGIYGGEWGGHVVKLMERLRMPVVSTLHTILEDPNEVQRKILMDICDRSDRVVVLSEVGVQMLVDIYGVERDKVEFIPHGIPELPFVDPSFDKDSLGLADRSVILTFGLLSENKGIEFVIKALPAVVEQHPEVMFLVVGATHPNVLLLEGEKYREGLEKLVRDLNLEHNVRFVNRFVGSGELHEFIGAADVCVTPYIGQTQVVSGALAYTSGSGKAVISTPYVYAKEILADGRGLLVKARDVEGFAAAINQLLGDDVERNRMRKKAFLYGRKMVWSEVARRYVELFEDVVDMRSTTPQIRENRKQTVVKKFPVFDLSHLERMSDDLGLLEHAKFSVPNYREGYSVDDNARGLLLGVLTRDLISGVKKERMERLMDRYLAFMVYAFNTENKRFRNDLDFDRVWKEKAGSSDSHGRCLWALGYAAADDWSEQRRDLATELYGMGVEVMDRFKFPRSVAYGILGGVKYLERFEGDSQVQRMVEKGMKKLVGLYRTQSTKDWKWFEKQLTYCNARMAEACLRAGYWSGDTEAMAVGLESLEWLMSLQFEDGHFVPIGNDGFYKRGGERARFDQQPVEAACAVGACLTAFELSKDLKWLKWAKGSFEWFLGKNDLGAEILDYRTGGCNDGLQYDRVNFNQGAESTLSFWMAWAQLQLVEHTMNGK